MFALPTMHSDPLFLSSQSHARDLRSRGEHARLVATARRSRRRR
jgi:hypothetical protein